MVKMGEEMGSAWPTGEQQSSCCSPVAFHFSPFASFFPSQPEAQRCWTCFSVTERKKQSPRLVAAVRFDLPSSQRDNWFGSLDASVFIVWGHREHKREEGGWLGGGEDTSCYTSKHPTSSADVTQIGEKKREKKSHSWSTVCIIKNWFNTEDSNQRANLPNYEDWA